jgi:hypothetical protein
VFSSVGCFFYREIKLQMVLMWSPVVVKGTYGRNSFKLLKLKLQNSKHTSRALPELRVSKQHRRRHNRINRKKKLSSPASSSATHIILYSTFSPFIQLASKYFALKWPLLIEVNQIRWAQWNDISFLEHARNNEYVYTSCLVADVLDITCHRACISI